MYSGIVNPTTPDNYQVIVTTRYDNGAVIDGPTPTLAYTVKQMGIEELADHSVMAAKIDRISMVWSDFTTEFSDFLYRKNWDMNFQPSIGDLSDNQGGSDSPVIALGSMVLTPDSTHVVWSDIMPLIVVLTLDQQITLVTMLEIQSFQL